jgi:sortase A
MSRHRGKTRRLFSWLFILVGGFFLFSGLRVVVESQLGQRDAAQQWQSETAQPAAVNPAPDLGDAIARLSIPRLNAEWFVFEGTGNKELRLGPGHMTGTAMPGMPGNCIIAAHRDTHFRVLKDIRDGDDVVLETRSGEFHYRVTRRNVVSPRNASALQPTAKAVLNLITCYPFYWVGPAPERYVVHAELQPVQTTQFAASGRAPS